MGMLNRLIEALKSGAAGRRLWTLQEVRELIDQRNFDAARRAAGQLSQNLRDRNAERACLLGEIAFQEQKDDEAGAAFRQALKEAPGLPSAHHGLSLLLAESGDFESAAQHSKFALNAAPLEPRILAQLGYCQLSMGNIQVAETPLRQATRLQPENASAWNNLGIVLLAKKKRAEARDCFQRAVSLRPNFAAARHHLEQLDLQAPRAVAEETEEVPDSAHTPNVQSASAHPLLTTVRMLEESQGLEAAINACETLAMEHPHDCVPVVELQRLYERSGDPQSGIDALEAFLARAPSNSTALATLGLACWQSQNHETAEKYLKQALELAPDRVDLLLALSQSFSSRGRYTECLLLVEKAYKISPDDKTIVGHWIATLTNCCRYEEALALCEQLAAEGKESACHGIVLSNLGRFDEALQMLDHALSHQPSDPNLRFQRAQIHLLRYHFAQGWDDYAYRGLSYSKDFRMLPFPRWRGDQTLEGKRIVVLAEQGLGDQVMFASCLQNLLSLNPSEIVVEVIGRIAPTIERSFPGCRIIATRQDRKLAWVKDLEEVDYFVPLGDLPRHFRRALNDFPQHKGYLSAAPDRIEHWKSQLSQLGPGPFVGLSWRGGTEVTRKSMRTIPAQMLAPLGALSSVTYVCLQYGDVEDDLKEAAAQGVTMAHWPEAISDLDEFAALIAALDLVITVCNTTVHYAGALGKPVWVMAPQVPEWRYGISGEAMPWYPSSKMFRQQVAGQWQPTIDKVCRELLMIQSVTE